LVELAKLAVWRVAWTFSRRASHGHRRAHLLVSKPAAVAAGAPRSAGAAIPCLGWPSHQAVAHATQRSAGGRPQADGCVYGV